MFDYIEVFLSDIPSSLKIDSVTAAPDHLFEIGDDSIVLHPTNANIYYHHMIHILWMAKRSRPDMLPPLSYLTTCVQSTNINYWNKLARTCKYLHSTCHLPLILEGVIINAIKWYIYVAF